MEFSSLEWSVCCLVVRYRCRCHLRSTFLTLSCPLSFSSFIGYDITSDHHLLVQYECRHEKLQDWSTVYCTSDLAAERPIPG
jgi:hypothetical protein